MIPLSLLRHDKDIDSKILLSSIFLGRKLLAKLSKCVLIFKMFKILDTPSVENLFFCRHLQDKEKTMNDRYPTKFNSLSNSRGS